MVEHRDVAIDRAADCCRLPLKSMMRGGSTIGVHLAHRGEPSRGSAGTVSYVGLAESVLNLLTQLHSYTSPYLFPKGV